MVLKKIGLWGHKLHEDAYSLYQLRASGLTPTSSMTPAERKFFLQFRVALKGDDLVVYDIGAARGTVSQCLSRLPNVSEIHAFEPLPDFFQALKNKMSQNKKVTCHNVALGDEHNTLTMYVNGWATSSSFLSPSAYLQEQVEGLDEIVKQIDIPVMRLDDYVASGSLPKPNVVKIDVQGFEKKVIEGGCKTIGKCNYCILEMSFKELYDESPLFDEIYRLLCDMGFRLVGLTEPMIGKSGEALQVDGIFMNLNH